jgi:ribosomal protein L37AE/L43A
MAIYQNDLNCDSCSTWYDGDPITILGRTPDLHGLTDPEKIRELTYFWLCRECKVEYPNGAKDFFVADYFEIVPLCARGCGEEVESENYVCDHCEDGEV